MTQLGLETGVVNEAVLERAIAHCRDRGVLLPTLAQLADPAAMGPRGAAGDVDPDAPDPANLFRVHWHNDASRRGIAEVPAHVVLPSSLTGVRAPIAVLLGDRFPMIHAHKVLAAYGCLVPRIVTGQFDPTAHRALWPSTGNYCRGGVAISRILGCRGVAILPTGMSRERFQWLDEWVEDPADIVRTPGSESNVKEIYDACEELDRDPQNVIFNQFCEFANHVVHRLCTGKAVERVAETVRRGQRNMKVRAFVSATGSAGTLAAGNHLKDVYGAKIVATEALECPTLLENGFGEHNIQGIGDKHVPLIHDAMNTDFVVAITDRATDQWSALLNSDTGQEYLRRVHDVPAEILAATTSFGFSGLANVLAAIKVAKHSDLGPDDLILTIATDGAALYPSELEKIGARDFPTGLDEAAAASVCEGHVLGADTDNMLELDDRQRRRIFNLGYFTWVEQRGVSLEDFVARRERKFWDDLAALPAAWDPLIESFNARTGVQR
ncbi:MAG: pyridoxal-5'-phosphate-dependent protein subunit beta [Planctomycetota bacterium]